MIIHHKLHKLLCAACLTLTAVSAHADLLSDIKARGEIVIATEARYEPFEMLEDGNRITSYNVCYTKLLRIFWLWLAKV